MVKETEQETPKMPEEKKPEVIIYKIDTRTKDNYSSELVLCDSKGRNPKTHQVVCKNGTITTRSVEIAEHFKKVLGHAYEVVRPEKKGDK